MSNQHLQKKHRQLGSHGEHQAQQYLLGKGYQILETNWHYSRSGELDIVALTNTGILVIVEVKTRNSLQCGHPSESITPAKQTQLCFLAEAFIASRPELCEHPLRFDLIMVLGHPPDDFTIEHLENIL